MSDLWAGSLEEHTVGKKPTEEHPAGKKPAEAVGKKLYPATKKPTEDTEKKLHPVRKKAEELLARQCIKPRDDVVGAHQEFGRSSPKVIGSTSEFVKR
ncbi:hypothetical protein BHE74_00013319 [Ensete ventricosum]|nr:hypothetical protein BHE74_00013319 [Ensete ventricosum]